MTTKEKRLIEVMLRAGYRHHEIVKASGYSLMTVKRVSRDLPGKPTPQYITKPWEELGLSKTGYYNKLALISDEEKERERRKRLITVMLQAGGFTHADIAEATGYPLETVEAVSAEYTEKSTLFI